MGLVGVALLVGCGRKKTTCINPEKPMSPACAVPVTNYDELAAKLAAGIREGDADCLQLCWPDKETYLSLAETCFVQKAPDDKKTQVKENAKKDYESLIRYGMEILEQLSKKFSREDLAKTKVSNLFVTDNNRCEEAFSKNGMFTLSLDVNGKLVILKSRNIAVTKDGKQAFLLNKLEMEE